MNPAGDGPTVELASPEDGPELFDFLHPHHYIHPDLDRQSFADCWRHQFFGAGKPCVLLVRDPEKNLAGHYGIMPMPYFVGGQERRAGFLCQLFIDPRYRKSNLFFKMERKLLKEHADFNFDFLYSLIIIPPVLTAHLALGLRRGADLHVYVFPLAVGGGLAGLWPRLPRFLRSTMDAAGRCLARCLLVVGRIAAGGVVVEEILDWTTMDWDLVARIEKDWKMHASRQAEAFARRLRPFGNKAYHVFAAMEDGAHSGYLILRRTKVQHFQVAAIIDVIAPESAGRIWSALLHHACQYGLEAGCNAAVALARPDSPSARRLRSNLFFRTRSRFTEVYSGLSGERERGPDWLDDWHLSWFDHDYI